jgi:peptide/nickel transport system permease protein
MKIAYSKASMGPASAVRKRQPWSATSMLHGALKWPLVTFSLAVMVVLMTMAVFADFIASDPYVMHAKMRMAPVLSRAPNGMTLLLGGDQLGRDLFSRIVFGARTSLLIGLCAVALGTTLGAAVGVASGYFGGKLDIVVQRWMDAQQSIPMLVLAMVIMGILGPSFVNVILAIAIVQIPRTNRVARGATLAVREQTYVDAARGVGCGHLRILLRHILPNVSAPIVVIGTVSLGSAILVEASLSFLGMGTPAPTPSWGSMISGAGREFLLRDPKLLYVPGLALMLTVMSFNLAGDALRDLLDPRLRGA